jgi:hypothetical protein
MAKAGLLTIAAIAAFAVSAPIASAAPPACTTDPGHQPPRDINTYLMFSWTDLYIKGGSKAGTTRGQFTGGNMGVNGTAPGAGPNLTFATNMRGFLTDGYSIVGDTVWLGPGNPPSSPTSTWDLYTNDIDNGSFVPSSIRNSGPWCYSLPVIDVGAPNYDAFTHSTGPYNPTMPSFPSHAVLDAKPDVTVPLNGTTNLAPGDYGTVTVSGTGPANGATLNLQDGIYNIDDLTNAKGATINTQRHTEVRVATKFKSNDDSAILGSNYARFYVRSDGFSSSTITLGFGRHNDGNSPDDCSQTERMRGQFFVPYGQANLGDCTTIFGRIWSDVVRNDQGISVTYDAPGGVTGTKYLDSDGDGVIDPGEPGLSGWTFFVDYDNDGNLDPGEPSAVTDVNGDYSIDDVDPGSWNVREVSQAGWVCSFPGSCVHAIDLAAGEVATDQDFANYQRPSVSGTKWEDVDGDGNRDAGDDGLAGWTFYVDYDDDGNLDPGEPFDVSDASGDYDIIDVNTGDYKVREVSQALWNCTSPSPCYYDETFSSGSALSGKDFGNHPDATASSASGTKWQDNNGDGTRDPGDNGLAGWTFYVDYDDDGNFDPGEPSGVSDSNGDFTIGGIAVGSYKIREISQADWSCTSPSPCYYSTTFSSGSSSPGNDFGNVEEASVSGTKWYDVDGDGNRDVGDDGLAGWTFFVDYNDDGNLDPGEPSDVSDANGDYTITGVQPGDYKVREVAQSGWNCTSPSPCYYDLSFSSGSSSTDNDFGNFPDVTLAGASGTKWQDENGDGIRDPGDGGLAGWTFYVDYNDNGNLDPGEPSDVTDGNGDFDITGVTLGNFKVREVGQAGWNCTAPSPCYYDQNFTSGNTESNNDFGNAQNASASGTKWNDANGNGSRDSGDNGLAGWTFYVDYNDNGSLDPGEPSDVSDSNGDFTIVGITLGNYKLREVAQTDWNCTLPAPCYYDRTFTSGGTSSGNDFGNHNTPPPSPPPPPPDGGGKKGGTGKGKTSAKIGGRTGCVTFSLLHVRGQNIKTVVFKVDGKVVSRHKASPYAIRIGKNYSVGVHRVRANVTFDTGATKSVTTTFHHCATRVKTRLAG